jgi:hypothetical protein
MSTSIACKQCDAVLLEGDRAGDSTTESELGSSPANTAAEKVLPFPLPYLNQ